MMFCWIRKISLRTFGFAEKIFSVLFLHDTQNNVGGMLCFFIILIASSVIFLFFGKLTENNFNNVVIDWSGIEVIFKYFSLA